MKGKSTGTFVILTQWILTLHLSCHASAANHLELIPGGVERVIDKEAFNITCKLTMTDQEAQDQEIKWTLPIDNDNKDVEFDVHVVTGHSQITVTTTATVLNADGTKTGNYSCGFFDRTTDTLVNITQFIYVKGNDLLSNYKSNDSNVTVPRVDQENDTCWKLKVAKTVILVILIVLLAMLVVALAIHCYSCTTCVR